MTRNPAPEQRNSAIASGGFTLFELTIVLFVIALLLGGLLVPLSTQVEATRIKETRELLREVREALMGFVVINDRLPCPASAASNGQSVPIAAVGGVQLCNNGGIAMQHGFVPGGTLGIAGTYNDDQLLVDPWGNPLRYSVSNRDCMDNNADGDCADAGESNNAWDYLVAGDMRAAGLNNLAIVSNNDLRICSDPNAAGDACEDANAILATNAVATFFSLGPDGSTYLAQAVVPPAELENAGEDDVAPNTLGGGPSGTNYPMANDNIFVSRDFRAAVGDEYDDLLDWIAPVLIINRMIEAQRLP